MITKTSVTIHDEEILTEVDNDIINCSNFFFKRFRVNAIEYVLL